MTKRRSAPAWGNHERAPLSADGLTHTGKRPRNEDRYWIHEDLGLVVVADGCGGAAGGDIAARIAVDEIASCFGAEEEQTLPNLPSGALADGLTVAMVRFAIEHAHGSIQYAARSTGPLGMSTAVALLVVAGPRVVIGYAGSVSVSRFRGGALEQLTSDPGAGARSACPVGAARGAVRPSVHVDVWEPGDRYLLSTSGLHRALSSSCVRQVLNGHSSLTDAAAGLVGRALHQGAADNLTAVIVVPQAIRDAKSAWEATRAPLDP